MAGTRQRLEVLDLEIGRRCSARPSGGPKRFGFSLALRDPTVLAQFFFVVDLCPQFAVKMLGPDHSQSDIGFDGR